MPSKRQQVSSDRVWRYGEEQMLNAVTLYRSEKMAEPSPLETIKEMLKKDVSNAVPGQIAFLSVVSAI